ncbi:uncharacterized protein [Arachis hypogaea]|uniref:uncharacterized protein n=1 Tax=Arachis hypogaea TaxID=3818 RepID=UPI003B21B9DF
MEWKRPTSVTEIRSFLGLAGYYRRFIKGFLQIALPLTKLTRKDAPLFWTLECEESFQALKQKLTTTPVLVLPELTEPFEVYSNVVADALSRKSLYASWMMLREEELLRAFESLKVGVQEVSGTLCLSRLQISSDFKSELLKAHQDDDVLPKVLLAIEQGKQWRVSWDQDGLWRFKGRIIVPDVGTLRQDILKKAHKSRFSIHPGSTKMYHDLKAMSGGLWESIAMDFMSGLPRTRIGFDAVWALYGRKCQSPLCWYEAGEKSLLGPELIAETTEQVKKIRDRMLTAQSCQKSYANQRQKTLEFEEGDHVFLKVTSTTGVGRAIKTKKLNPRYIGPFQILERVRPVAYQMALPPHLSNMHDAFHVLQLRKYTLDASHVLEQE